MKILLFAGTKNGRELALRLAQADHEVIISSMSAYGDSLLPDHKNIRTVFGQKSVEAIVALILEEDIHVVIDSTHPYAVEISNNLLMVSRITRLRLIRFERKTVVAEEVGKHFSSMEAVITYLEEKQGNVLFTTGVNDVPMIARRLNAERIYVRVLPIETSLQRIMEARLHEDHVVSKNPPFTVEENLEHIDSFKIQYLVTKDSGKEGNILEKIEAVKERDVELLVIDRPDMNYDYVCYSQEAILQEISEIEQA